MMSAVRAPAILMPLEPALRLVGIPGSGIPGEVIPCTRSNR